MDVVSYKCPNCAAGLSFDIEQQNWHCNFCRGSFTLEQLKDQDPDATANATEQPSSEEAAAASPDEGVAAAEFETYDGDATAFTCPSCGGRIITDKNTAATFCIYCHNPTVLAARLENEYRPVQLIPFKLEKDAVVDTLKKYCRKRPLLPRDFVHYAHKGEVSGLYVPFWLFDTDIDAFLRGVGRRVTTWSDRSYRYTKTDSYRVERGGRMSFRGVPADGSSKMDDRLMEALEPFDYGQMVKFSMQYLSGHFAEGYDVGSDDAAKRALGRVRSGVDTLMRAQVSGYTSTAVTSLTSNSKNTRCTYVMLPVWTLMTRYNDKQYIFAMNGQTGKIAGSLPVSWRRFWTMCAGLFGALFAIFFAGGMLL